MTSHIHTTQGSQLFGPRDVPQTGTYSGRDSGTMVGIGLVVLATTLIAIAPPILGALS